MRKACNYGLGWADVKNEKARQAFEEEMEVIVSDFLFLLAAAMGFVAGFLLK